MRGGACGSPRWRRKWWAIRRRCCGSCLALSAWCCWSRARTWRCCRSCVGLTARWRPPCAWRWARLPGRLLRQSWLESLVLALVGGLVGVALAASGLRLIPLLVPDFPRLHEVALSPRVVSFAFAVTAVTAVLSGLLPAWRGSRAEPARGLRGASVRTTDWGIASAPRARRPGGGAGGVGPGAVVRLRAAWSAASWRCAPLTPASRRPACSWRPFFWTRRHTPPGRSPAPTTTPCLTRLAIPPWRAGGRRRRDAALRARWDLISTDRCGPRGPLTSATVCQPRCGW